MHAIQALVTSTLCIAVGVAQAGPIRNVPESQAGLVKPRVLDNTGTKTLRHRVYGDPFTLVIIPDSQYTEVMEKGSDQIWDDPYGRGAYMWQAQWIVGQWHRNVLAALHVGDVVQDGIRSQFAIADPVHSKMEDAGIPCLVVPGNHDYQTAWGDPCSYLDRSLEEYSEVFGSDRFTDRYPEVYGSRYIPMDDSGVNFAYKLDAEGLPLLVVGLEFAPRKDAICWADGIIAQHPSRRVIVLTHCYNAHPDDDDYSYSDCAEKYCVNGYRGETLWNDFVSRHNNILMVLSGHINDSKHWERAGNDGNTVHEILTDYQYETPEYRIQSDAKGGGECASPDSSGQRGSESPCSPSRWYCGTGNGWLRTLTFYPLEYSFRVEVESVNAFEGRDDFNHYFPDGEPVFFCSTYDNDPQHSDHRYSFHIDRDWSPLDYAYIDNGSSSFPDRIVNSEGAYQQLNAVVARSPAGNFVVAWEDNTDGNDFTEIYARGFDAQGCQLFPDFRVNSSSKGQQAQPVIGMDADGNFAIAWMDDAEDDDIWQIKVRGFDSNGDERFSQRTVNDPPKGDQRYPDLDMDSDGDFYVVWADDVERDGKWQVKGRSYHSNGVARIAPMTINAVADGQQRDPAVAATNDGFVVVWEDDQENDGKYQVKARGFTAVGVEDIPQFTVNTDYHGQQWNADVEAAAEGDFVVVWEDNTDGNRFYQMKARGFDADGDERIAQFTVNSRADGQQKDPAIGMSPDGYFFIVWSDDKEDDGQWQIWGRGFYPDGVQRREDFNINDFNDGQQRDAEVALDGFGNFVVVWEDDLNSDGWFQITAAGFDAL